MTFDLNTTWYLLVGVLFTGYAILDGFDLGVGIVHLAARGDRERRTLMNSIGPLWDGNEVWLITFGGALFAAVIWLSFLRNPWPSSSNSTYSTGTSRARRLSTTCSASTTPTCTRRRCSVCQFMYTNSRLNPKMSSSVKGTMARCVAAIHVPIYSSLR